MNTPQISTDAMAVLAACSIDSNGQKVTIPGEVGQLERSLYEEVNEVLTRLRGKWNKKVKGHLFPYDPAPLLAAVLSTGTMPPKNPTAFFPTPAPVIEKMFSWIEWNTLPDDARILEPSAGTGAFAEAIMAKKAELGTNWTLDCCELLDVNRAMLEAKGFNLVADDFLQYQPTEPYHLIVMNPPFSVEGDKNAYVTHVNHAWSMVKEGYQLAAITATGFSFRQSKAMEDFADLVMEHGEWAELGAGEFKESGTGVNTALVWMRKEDQAWRRHSYCGWNSWHSWACQLWAENERSAEEALYKLAKEQPADMAEKVRRVFDEVQKTARKAGDPVRLNDADHAYLLGQLLDRYDIKPTLAVAPAVQLDLFAA